MIRSVAILAAVLALLASQARADEEQGPQRPLGLILTLKTWPPEGEAADLIRETLEQAGLEESDRLERVQTWLFRPSGSTGPGNADICADLMRDERMQTLLEGCWPDEPVFPQSPVPTRQ